MRLKEVNECFSSKKCLLRWTLDKIRFYAIKPSKRRDQHFLVHPRILKDFVILFKDSKGLNCIEIGTGLGTLSLVLSKLFKKVLSIEIDQKLAKIAKEIVPNNAQIIIGDGLKILNSSCIEVVASNSPYSLSSLIVATAAKNNCIKRAALILQKELALRAVASPGDENYGRFSVLAQRYFSLKIISIYPPNYFYPPPLVDSALIYLERKRLWNSEDESFEKLTGCLFSGRNKLARKMVKKCLNLDEGTIKWLGKKRVRELTLEDLEMILKLQ